MKPICRKCGNEIPGLILTEEQKLELWGLMAQDLKLFAAKKLMDEHNYSHEEAKVIVAHLNNRNGKCIQCNFDELDSENIECPKCGAFNYNLRGPAYDYKFCLVLEFSLAFEELEQKDVNNFWCDGIDSLPSDIKSLSIKNIIQQKRIETKAWIGNDGQDEYEMIITLGNQSIENYKNGLSLVDCIYTDRFDEWIKIEPENKKIEILLK